MRRRTKAVLLLTPFVLLLASIAACNHYHIYINLTRSLPRGIYRLMPEEKIMRGDIVLVVDLEEMGLDRALCPYKGLLKQIAAFEGDMIDSDGKQVYINGRILPYSEIFTKDKYGKNLPQQQYPYTIPNGAAYLTSLNKYGYDSRYYGPVDKRRIAGKARLLLKFPRETQG